MNAVSLVLGYEIRAKFSKSDGSTSVCGVCRGQSDSWVVGNLRPGVFTFVVDVGISIFELWREEGQIWMDGRRRFVVVDGLFWQKSSVGKYDYNVNRRQRKVHVNTKSS